MAKDIHAKPFDEGTLIKLELFRLYIREWLPVFIRSKVDKIELFDFFAGEGTDSEGSFGSPLIILDELKPYCANLKMNPTEVSIFFNDSAKKKVEILEFNTNAKLQSCISNKKFGFCKYVDGTVNCPFKIKFINQEFKDLFAKGYKYFYKNQSIPRFMFIDQYGIKQVTQDVFSQLTNLKHTDFMFFISSNHIMRFKEQPGFQAYIDSSRLDFSDTRPAECHRVIFNYYKSLLAGEKYFLGQFSIKKNNNIYGVIFGSNHPLGLKKFLDSAWKLDPHTGETNYDIDDDAIRVGQTTLDFSGTGNADKIKKLAGFENELILFLKTAQTNQSIYIFALEKGISISKTNEILRNLENNERLIFTGDKRQKGGYYLDFEHNKTILIKSK